MELRYIPPEAVDRILSIASIVDVISSRVELKKQGRNYHGLCPFHTEKTASFTVSEEKQFYHCFGCGAHGTAISFLMEFTAAPFVDAVTALAAEIGFDLTPYAQSRKEDPNQHLYTLNRKVAEDYHRYLQISGNMAGVTLEKRGITEKTIEKFMLGYSLDKWDDLLSRYGGEDLDALKQLVLVKENADNRLYDVFRHRLIFPIRSRSGDVVAFGGRVLRDERPKYLNSEETVLFSKRETLYGLYENRKGIREAGYALVVEGYMDVVGLSEHGVENAVASMGTSLTDKQLALLSRSASRIVLCFDGDKAGQKAAARSLEVLLPLINDSNRIAYVMLPEDADPDSFIAEKGKAAFDELVAAALPLSDFFLNCAIPKEGVGDNLETRLDLLEAIKRQLHTIRKAPRFKQILGQEVARRLDIPEDMVFDEAPEGQEENKQPQRSKPAKTLAVSVMTPLRKAVAILLQQPGESIQAAKAIAGGGYPYLSGLETAGVRMLIEISEIISKNPEVNSAGIIARYQEDQEKERALARLLVTELSGADVLGSELLQILRNLDEEGRQHLIRTLTNKPFSEFTDEDREQLQALGV